jgi:hypothetical protein
MVAGLGFALVSSAFYIMGQAGQWAGPISVVKFMKTPLEYKNPAEIEFNIFTKCPL